MSRVNRAFSRVARFGAFHVTIEVYYREYTFGTQGVASATAPYIRKSTHVESVHLGVLQQSKKEVITVMKQLQEEWPGAGYNVIHRNCCDFCEEVCRRFGVGPLPGRVTRLPRLCAAFDNSLPGGRRFPDSADSLGPSVAEVGNKKKLTTSQHSKKADGKAPFNENCIPDSDQRFHPSAADVGSETKLATSPRCNGADDKGRFSKDDEESDPGRLISI